MDIETAKNTLSDPAELVRFMTAPRDWVIERGLDPDDEETARTFEGILRGAHDGLQSGVAGSGIKPMVASERLKGIGFGCCNV